MSRSEPVAAFVATQRRREHNFAWLAWVVYGPCVLALIVGLVAFVVG